METSQKDSIQQLFLKMQHRQADELHRLEESQGVDLQMMRDHFEELLLRQETGRTQGSQDLEGRRTNASGSLGGGSIIAGDRIPNLDLQVSNEALDTRPTGEASRISL